MASGQLFSMERLAARLTTDHCPQIMPLFAQQSLSLAALLVLGLLAVASLALWTLIAVRRRRGLAVLPYQPRRRVRRQGVEVLLVFMVYLTAPVFLGQLGMRCFDLGDTPAPATATEDLKFDAQHPVGKLLLKSPTVWTIALCALSAVVVAPLVEELLFRLLLQGWMEAVERRWRKRVPWLRRLLPGAAPVMIASLLFASMHIRAAVPEMSVQQIAFQLVVFVWANLLTLLFAVCLVCAPSGATLEDLGVVPGKLAADAKLGLLAFLAVTAPVYLLLMLVNEVLPKNVVADPIPLLFLAFALGVLYYRTHRIAAAIVLHMAFNVVALVMALLTVVK